MRPHASRVADSCCAGDVHVYNIAGWSYRAIPATSEMVVDVVCSQCRKTDTRTLSLSRWEATPAHLRPALVL